MRSAIAVLCGYLIFAISGGLLFALSGHDPKAAPGAAFLVLSTLYGMAFAFAGGWTAARLAPSRPRLHANTVAGILAGIALVSMLVQMRHGSVWSQLAALFLMAPMAVAGGRLRR